MDLRTFKNGVEPIVLESINEIARCQDTGKGSYLNIVLEATVNPTSNVQGVLVQKLYKEIITKGSIDYGHIPESKGDIQKYKEIGTIDSCIGTMDKLFAGKKVPEFDLLKSL